MHFTGLPQKTNVEKSCEIPPTAAVNESHRNSPPPLTAIRLPILPKPSTTTLEHFALELIPTAPLRLFPIEQLAQSEAEHGKVLMKKFNRRGRSVERR